MKYFFDYYVSSEVCENNQNSAPTVEQIMKEEILAGLARLSVLL